MPVRELIDSDVAEILRGVVIDDITLDPAEDVLVPSVLAVKSYIDTQDVAQKYFDEIDPDSGVNVEASTGGSTLKLTGGTSITTSRTASDEVTITNDAPATGNEAQAAAVITDHAVVRGDGGVRGVQGSGVTIDDSGNLTLTNDKVIQNADTHERIQFLDSDGGMIDFYTANTQNMRLDSSGDLDILNGDLIVQDHTIESISTNDARMYGSATSWNRLSSGTDDTTRGAFRAFGDGTGSTLGGMLQLQTAADHDGTIPEYEFRVVEDDLTIGPETDQDSLKYHGGTGVWEFTGTGGVDITGDLELTSGGNVTLDGGGKIYMEDAGYLRIQQGGTDNNTAEYGTTSWSNAYYIGHNLQYDGSGTPASNMQYIREPGTYNMNGTAIISFINNNSQLRFYTAPASTGADAAATLTEQLRIIRTSPHVMVLQNFDVAGDATVDGDVDIGGLLTLDGASKYIEIKEQTGPPAGRSAFGTIWVKNTSPCQLWFTRDDGTDVQLS